MADYKNAIDRELPQLDQATTLPVGELWMSQSAIKDMVSCMYEEANTGKDYERAIKLFSDKIRDCGLFGMVPDEAKVLMKEWVIGLDMSIVFALAIKGYEAVKIEDK